VRRVDLGAQGRERREARGFFLGLRREQGLDPRVALLLGLDRAQYYSSIFGNFQGVVQYNLEAGPPYVSDVCDAVDGAPSPIEALAAATSLFSSNGTACLSSDFEKDYVSVLRNATFDGVSADRQWIWQSCNEFGFFQTISPKSPFAAFGAYLNVTTAGRAVCAGGFGVDEYDGPRADAAGLVANAFYGGRALQGINITAVNGNISSHSEKARPRRHGIHCNLKPIELADRAIKVNKRKTPSGWHSILF
jgi:hypothetical protein